MFHAHQRKKNPSCPAPHPAQHCRRPWRGEVCTLRALAEGLLLPLCAKVLGSSSSPDRPRNDKWGLIRSSHRRVIYFEISCRKSALLSLPVSVRAWWGTAGVPQPTGTVLTLAYGDVRFTAILTGPQLRQSSRALVANGLASPRVLSRGTKTGGNVALQCLDHPAAGPIAHRRLSRDFSFVLVPERSARQGLHRSFPDALWVSRLSFSRCFAEQEGCQLRKSPLLATLLRSHSSLRHSLTPANIFFQATKGKRVFCQGGTARTRWPRDRLWSTRCCAAPGCRVPSSDVLEGLACACLLRAFGKAGSPGRHRAQVLSYTAVRVKDGFSNAREQAVVWGEYI